jgi:hypothetical protein
MTERKRKNEYWKRRGDIGQFFVLMIKWSGGFVYLDLSFLIEKVSFTETENGKKIDNIVMFCMVVSFFF